VNTPLILLKVPHFNETYLFFDEGRF
jgi:hypothetical protein